MSPFTFTKLLSQLPSLNSSRKMAGRASYSPVDRQSLSADDAAHSLLSQDEKTFVLNHRSTTAQRRYQTTLKAFLLLLLLVFHAGLVVLLAKWLASSFLGAHGSMSPDEMHSDHSNSCLLRDEHTQYTFDGVIPAVYKDPSAEFIMKDPCGHSAAEARAKGCRYGMLYGAWLPEQCYDEETEQNFKKYTDWRFWLQPNRTEELSWDEVEKGEHEFVLVEWQCEFPWPLTVDGQTRETKLIFVGSQTTSATALR